MKGGNYQSRNTIESGSSGKSKQRLWSGPFSALVWFRDSSLSKPSAPVPRAAPWGSLEEASRLLARSTQGRKALVAIVFLEWFLEADPVLEASLGSRGHDPEGKPRLTACLLEQLAITHQLCVRAVQDEGRWADKELPCRAAGKAGVEAKGDSTRDLWAC